MAARLQLKLGAITDQDRLADSPDTSVVVEPSVGSVARTKGNLYLLVTSRQPGSRAREATRVVAETIRNEYYYDESAGIRQCLTKVLVIANKRLVHQRDRYGLGHQSDGAGPIGVAVAVIRGRELYVATVGPAEAYLIRQARLSTLPDPNGERGMPVADLEPEVWRGDLSVGDSLCLVSANLVARVGTDTLKDALVTLHPQSAVEHLHAAFVAADGTGSDGAVAIEAAELGVTQKVRTLVPVRSAEPLAGAPDRSPIPLADSVSAGAAALGASAGRARTAAGSGFGRLIGRLQDRLPRRGPGVRKVSNASGRMETQRRAAVGLLAFVVVAGALVLAVYAAGSQRPPVEAIESLTAAEQAFEAASEALSKVTGSGIDLIADDPKRALELLDIAYEELAKAEAAGYPSSRIAPLRKATLAGLDRLYGMVNVRSTDLFTFPIGENPVALAGLVVGSDGAPYVLDTANKTVWRIDLGKKTATPVIKSGQKASGTKVADPRFITAGGPDILVLDSKNVLWRWRPVDTKGKGTLVRIKVTGSASWGDDILGIATFVANFDAAFYKLYIIDPSEQNVMVLSPANDGSGYPIAPGRKLPTDRPVDGMTDLLIDGDIYVAEDGAVARVIPASKWVAEMPGDTQLRPSSSFTLLSSPNLFDGSSSRRKGPMYAFDATNQRLVAINKLDGAYLGQFQLEAADPSWNGLVDMVVRPPTDETGPATMWWISPTGLHSVELAIPVPAGDASPSPSEPSPSAVASTAPTKAPPKTPKP